MHRFISLAGLLFVLSGCANMSAPKHIAAATCQGDQASSICLLDRLQTEYESYSHGAAKSQAVTDAVMLASAATGVIGAAVGSSSDLYKSAGAVGLSALGFSTYGNFKDQEQIVTAANSRLTCARPELETLLEQKKRGIQFVSSGRSMGLIGFSPITDQDLASLKQDFRNPTSSKTALANIRNNMNLRSNAETADKILKTINREATSQIMALQENVTKAIKNDSFDVTKAISVITTKPKLEATIDTQSEGFIGASSHLTPDDVIDAYNAFIKCMAGQKPSEEP